MIVRDRSRSLGSLVNCSAIVTIIWKPNFHFASDRQQSQRLPTIATITITRIESVYLCDRSDRERIVSNRNKLMETTSAAIAAIVTIPAIIWKSIFSNCDDPSVRNDPAIVAIVAIVHDHMETRRNVHIVGRAEGMGGATASLLWEVWKVMKPSVVSSLLSRNWKSRYSLWIQCEVSLIKRKLKQRYTSQPGYQLDIWWSQRICGMVLRTLPVLQPHQFYSKLSITCTVNLLFLQKFQRTPTFTKTFINTRVNLFSKWPIKLIFSYALYVYQLARTVFKSLLHLDNKWAKCLKKCCCFFQYKNCKTWNRWL